MCWEDGEPATAASKIEAMTWRRLLEVFAVKKNCSRASRRSSIEQQLAAKLIALGRQFSAAAPLMLRLSLPFLAATALAATADEPEGDLMVPLILGVAIVLVLGWVMCGPGSAPTGAPVMTHRPESLSANLESAKDD